MATQLPRDSSGIRREWRSLSTYRLFELLVAYVLRVVIGAVILVAFFRLVVGVVDTLVLRALNPLEHEVFQQVFGAIMTLLIALEFSHTLQYGLAPHVPGVIQARIVIVIAQLALARKVVVMDVFEAPPGQLAALAGLILSLGATYWFMREAGGRVAADGTGPGQRSTTT
jgi:uncharacterized membrane protein (DUF373 family)